MQQALGPTYRSPKGSPNADESEASSDAFQLFNPDDKAEDPHAEEQMF